MKFVSPHETVQFGKPIQRAANSAVLQLCYIAAGAIVRRDTILDDTTYFDCR
jgi:hypothetical protein